MGSEQAVSGPAGQPSPLVFAPTLRGRAVFCLWAALPGILAAPFLFWQGAIWGVLFCMLWAAGVAALWLRTGSLTAELGEYALVIRAGRFFPTRRTFPRASIASVLELGSPLLRMSGARVLVLLSPGAGAILPGLPRSQAELLCEELGHPVPAAWEPPPEDAP